MALESRIGFVGVSKQTAKGSANTTPTYGFGLRSGRVLQTDIDQGAEEITSLDRFASSAFRNSILQSIDATTRLYPRSIGMLLFGVLGAKSVTGAGPYTHTFSPANSLPYLTGFGRLDSEYGYIKDCRVEALTISWEGSSPPEVAFRLLGTTITYGSTWTATNDESSQTILPTAGGTFKVDAGSSTAATADVAGGSITFSNAVQPVVLSKQIEADDIVPGQLSVECSLRLLPANLNEWRKIVTGASGGTAATTSVVYGSYDVKFALDASNSLQVASPKVAFVADFPDVSPSGGPVELTVVGQMVKPSAGNAVTATLVNDQTSY